MSGLNILSIGLGVVITLGLVFLVWSQRERLLALRRGAESRIEKTRSQLSSNMDQRYRSAVIEMANSMHLASHLVPLEKIAVQPRFFMTPPPFDISQADDPAISVEPMDLVPIVPEYPEMLGSYNVETLGIDELLISEDNILLLGQPGSGRTVSLAMLALLIAKRRITLNMEEASRDEAIPLYLHLEDLPLEIEEIGQVSDPILPLLEAGRAKLKFLAGQALAAVQDEFIGGRGVILIDGLDEVPPERLGDVFDWITALAELYDNKLVVAGGPTGFAPLLDHDFAPVFVRPWMEEQSTKLATSWAEAWPEIMESEANSEAVTQAPLMTSGLSALDVTLKTWGMLAGDVVAEERMTWYDGYINRVTGFPLFRGALERLAGELHLDGDDSTRPLREISPIFEEAFRAAENPPEISVGDFIYTITHRTKLLEERPGSEIRFTNRVIAAYLAAHDFAGQPFNEALTEPRRQNRTMMPFLGGLHDLTEYVAYQLHQPRTLSRDEILQMGRWLHDAPPGMMPWRNKVLQAFRTILTAPQTYPGIRERACAALAASRNERAAEVFISAVESPNHDITLLGCLGLGALRALDGIPVLAEELTNPNAGLETAAALAMGAIGDTNSVNYAIETLVTGSSLARRASAEQFALNLSGEGHEILQEAMEEEDPETRRAAVFGLKKLGKTEWAVELVDDARKRDDEWLVRTAAEDAWHTMTGDPERIPTHVKRANEITWIQAGYEDELTGERGHQAMLHFFENGNAAEQLAMVDLFGALGERRAVEPLYNKLGNDHAEIRDAAHRALLSLSRVTGAGLPTP
jgi:HEAT repeat protein